MQTVRYRWWAAACALPLILPPAPAAAATAASERVSVSLAGGQPDGFSGYYGAGGLAINPDGRYVAFQSEASDLAPGDTNGSTDVFVRDRQTGVTTIVSVRPDGTTGTEASYEPAISDDGRYVAFSSGAVDLVAGDTNERADVFIRDLHAGTTVRASLNQIGEELNHMSYLPALSADGRYVAFTSYARNLPFTDGNGGRWADLFLRDMVTGDVALVSRSVTGTGANLTSLYAQISADGRYVAFHSRATNLVLENDPQPNDVATHGPTSQKPAARKQSPRSVWIPRT